MQKTEYISIRVTGEMRHYFDVLSEKYHVKRSQFIRDAILEKLKKDVPKIRQQSKKSDCPF